MDPSGPEGSHKYKKSRKYSQKYSRRYKNKKSKQYRDFLRNLNRYYDPTTKQLAVDKLSDNMDSSTKTPTASPKTKPGPKPTPKPGPKPTPKPSPKPKPSESKNKSKDTTKNYYAPTTDDEPLGNPEAPMDPTISARVATQPVRQSQVLAYRNQFVVMGSKPQSTAIKEALENTRRWSHPVEGQDVPDPMEGEPKFEEFIKLEKVRELLDAYNVEKAMKDSKDLASLYNRNDMFRENDKVIYMYNSFTDKKGKLATEMRICLYSTGVVRKVIPEESRICVDFYVMPQESGIPVRQVRANLDFHTCLNMSTVPFEDIREIFEDFEESERHAQTVDGWPETRDVLNHRMESRFSQPLSQHMMDTRTYINKLWDAYRVGVTNRNLEAYQLRHNAILRANSAFAGDRKAIKVDSMICALAQVVGIACENSETNKEIRRKCLDRAVRKYCSAIMENFEAFLYEILKVIDRIKGVTPRECPVGDMQYFAEEWVPHKNCWIHMWTDELAPLPPEQIRGQQITYKIPTRIKNMNILRLVATNEDEIPAPEHDRTGTTKETATIPRGDQSVIDVPDDDDESTGEEEFGTKTTGLDDDETGDKNEGLKEKGPDSKTDETIIALRMQITIMTDQLTRLKEELSDRDTTMMTSEIAKLKGENRTLTSKFRFLERKVETLKEKNRQLIEQREELMDELKETSQMHGEVIETVVRYQDSCEYLGDIAVNSTIWDSSQPLINQISQDKHPELSRVVADNISVKVLQHQFMKMEQEVKELVDAGVLRSKLWPMKFQDVLRRWDETESSVKDRVEEFADIDVFNGKLLARSTKIADVIKNYEAQEPEDEDTKREASSGTPESPTQGENTGGANVRVVVRGSGKDPVSEKGTAKKSKSKKIPTAFETPTETKREISHTFAKIPPDVDLRESVKTGTRLESKDLQPFLEVFQKVSEYTGNPHQFLTIRNCPVMNLLTLITSLMIATMNRIKASDKDHPNMVAISPDGAAKLHKWNLCFQDDLANAKQARSEYLMKLQVFMKGFNLALQDAYSASVMNNVDDNVHRELRGIRTVNHPSFSEDTYGVSKIGTDLIKMWAKNKPDVVVPTPPALRDRFPGCFALGFSKSAVIPVNKGNLLAVKYTLDLLKAKSRAGKSDDTKSLGSDVLPQVPRKTETGKGTKRGNSGENENPSKKSKSATNPEEAFL